MIASALQRRRFGATINRIPANGNAPPSMVAKKYERSFDLSAVVCGPMVVITILPVTILIGPFPVNDTGVQVASAGRPDVQANETAVV